MKIKETNICEFMSKYIVNIKSIKIQKIYIINHFKIALPATPFVAFLRSSVLALSPSPSLARCLTSQGDPSPDPSPTPSHLLHKAGSAALPPVLLAQHSLLAQRPLGTCVRA